MFCNQLHHEDDDVDNEQVFRDRGDLFKHNCFKNRTCPQSYNNFAKATFCVLKNKVEDS
ncbi:hypothetical protein EVA_03719 [gut metagenome]|uniref:Uncharacterized protein n=1 Tax=gut metagenome TaxID=749906 RepID=J9GYC9_9ZZZZ